MLLKIPFSASSVKTANGHQVAVCHICLKFVVQENGPLTVRYKIISIMIPGSKRKKNSLGNCFFGLGNVTKRETKQIKQYLDDM